MAKLEAIENCDNCGRVIGRLEQVHAWGEHVVCGGCISKLNQPIGVTKKKPLGLIIVFLIVSLATIVGSGAFIRSETNARRAAAEKAMMEAYFRELESTGEYVYNTMATRSIAAGPNILTAQLTEISGRRFLMKVEITYKDMIEYKKQGVPCSKIISLTRDTIISEAESTIGKAEADAYLTTTEFLKP